ncbi:phosphate acetyltransferase [Cellvibrio sp. UBA7671]|uniref:phosphate acetyltransferase n=1 Tax=Cellvibrio sp. UBA7671 TaxID=1946312 RepID=UPI002F35D1F5
MKQVFFVAPTGFGTGLTSVCLGLVRAMDQQGLNVGFCKPIAQHSGTTTEQDPSLLFAGHILGRIPEQPLNLDYAQSRLATGEVEQLLEDVVSLCQRCGEGVDILVVEGLVPQANSPFIQRLNIQIANALDSDIVLVAAKNQLSDAELSQQIGVTANFYRTGDDERVVGCILNKVGAPQDPLSALMTGDDGTQTLAQIKEDLSGLQIFANGKVAFLGQVYFEPSFLAPRVGDVSRRLNCRSLNDKADFNRRVNEVTVCARRVNNMLDTLKAGTLVVTPGDREDILLVACLAVLNGVQLAGILLTGGYTPDKKLMQLCQVALDTGLPIILCDSDTYRTAQKLERLNLDVPADDAQRIEQVIRGVSENILMPPILARTQRVKATRLSPAAFRHQLVQRAGRDLKRIVLPEGEEIRTIQAAIICAQKGIAKPVLLGNRDNIQRIAESLSLVLPASLTILQPEEEIEKYVAPLLNRRGHKGLTREAALEMLEDTVVLGTMMLALDEVDGLVSGAIHTTANTIRPALQLIKPRPDCRLVSSIFFMCLPEQVLVYGDCAVNPDPNAEELADIAIQSGDSARAFGIEPRIAMISYSTGTSGAGIDVDKVREATRLAKARRPDLLIDGPLQYDAASVAAVASQKAPDSMVAGKATVYIFPDLNTGNTTYKAVQRSANVVSIGPMLQGLNKPVNDLSRGALVEDIVYTIALTAIQAQH